GVAARYRQFEGANIIAGKLFFADRFTARVERAFKRRLQREMQMDRANGKRPGCESRTELVEQSAQKKGKRLQILDRVFQFKKFLEAMRRFGDDQRSDTISRSDGVHPHTFLPNTFRKRNYRQRGERFTSLHAPAFEYFTEFLTQRKHVHRQALQKFCFPAFRNNRSSR